MRLPEQAQEPVEAEPEAAVAKEHSALTKAQTAGDAEVRCAQACFPRTSVITSSCDTAEIHIYPQFVSAVYLVVIKR